MSQETLKMLEKARERLAVTAGSLESLMMDLVTSRLQMMFIMHEYPVFI